MGRKADRHASRSAFLKTTPPKFVSAESCAGYVGRFGEGKVAEFLDLRAWFGVPDVAVLAAGRRQVVE
ncbi:hypothetical protein [Streptomyces sp. BE133]|uniref:hypothetical protein n=1 Tax=Streptomyces sp. BE133 TaxID=3002523 RepID=UPI002E78539B|nr:hypothetical protein [Streptomyces sp. BE133]MEE1809043.1 hypothetical protein [Streptomyces sp. BE133]